MVNNLAGEPAYINFSAYDIVVPFPFRHMFVKCVAFQTSGESNVFEPRFVSQEFDVVFMPMLPDDAVKVCYKSIIRFD